LEPVPALSRLPLYEAFRWPTTQGTGFVLGFWGLLTSAERDALSGLGRYRTFPPGATICVEGEPATYVYVLVAGWVKVLSATSDGREIVLALRGNGDLVGEMAAETTGHRNATIQALDAVRALIVGYDRFSSFLDANPGAAHAHRRVVMQRWNDADTMLRSRSVTTGAQRVAALLLDLAGRHGSEASGVIDLAMPLTQEELASLAGTSRATVARAFRNWRMRGLVRTGQRRIAITDAGGLRRAAGQRA
jgi:CRP/FNR family cyclic AMP-dependent transcriptional regulator